MMISKPNRPNLPSQFPRKDQIANPSVLDMKSKENKARRYAMEYC